MSYQYADTEETRADVVSGINEDNTEQMATLENFLAAASAMIDQYTKRPAGYFSANTANDGTVRRFRGEGKNYLRIGRHIPGSVTIANFTTADFYEAPNGWPYMTEPAGSAGPGYDSNFSNWSGCRIFVKGSLYEVTAKWGFAETPADIVQACKMIAAHLWDRGQGTFGQISPDGFVIERDMPPTAATILNQWVRKEMEIN